MKELTFTGDHQYGMGQTPAIAVNDKDEFVEIHGQNIVVTAMFYGTGTLEYDRAKFLKNGGNLKAGTLGRDAKIALNNEGDVVAFYNGAFTTINYSVGKLKDGIVNWGRWHDSKTGGFRPAVAIKKNSQDVIMVYEADSWLKRYVWYKVGVLDPDTQQIHWHDKKTPEWGEGYYPAISVNNTGKVVGAFLTKSNLIGYRIGTLTENDIEWSHYFYAYSNLKDKSIRSISVNVSDNNHVIISFYKDNKACYILGSIEGEQIKFHTDVIEIYDSGASVSLAANNSRALLVTSGKTFATVHTDVGAYIDYSNWIGNGLKSFGDKNLRQMVLPGSHDAGMSMVQHCTTGARPCNTQTQRLSIREQLQSGIRFFDIRPTWTDGNFFMGHYSRVLGAWRGCAGESIDDILQSVAEFLETDALHNKEIIILTFSHDRDLNTGNALSNAQYIELTNRVYAALGSYLYTTPLAGARLSEISLSDMLNDGSVVLPLFSRLTSPTAGVYPYRTFENGESPDPDPNISFNIFDDYSETDTLNTMITDQYNKFGVASNRSGDTFVFSWTLTQQKDQPVTCRWSILDLADLANATLESHMVSSISNSTFTADKVPNIIYTDDCQRMMTRIVRWMNEMI